MKKTVLYFVLGTIVLLLAGCGARRSQAYYAAPSKVLSANYDGSYVIRVQVRARNAAIAFTDGQRKAVQEVIFDGVSAGSNGIADLKPLCFDRNAREKHEDYGENMETHQSKKSSSFQTGIYHIGRQKMLQRYRFHSRCWNKSSGYRQGR